MKFNQHLYELFPESACYYYDFSGNVHYSILGRKKFNLKMVSIEFQTMF